MKALILALLVIATGCGPIPGGSLSGRAAPVPADWTSEVSGGRTICEIESRPENPHSIQLECFLYEGALYVQSHRWARASWWPVQSWAAIWVEHPDVRVRIGDSLYDLTAREVADASERAAILSFRGYDPVPEGIVVFRFEPRGGAVAPS
jgi:hypothetical protein